MTEILVVCAIIERDNTVLVAQRSSTMSLAMHWEFPGGKVKPNETEEVSLLREIKEELNIDVRVHKRLTPSKYFDGEKLINLIPFACSIWNGEPSAIEHNAILWCDQEKCQTLHWCPADIPIVNAYWQLRNSQ